MLNYQMDFSAIRSMAAENEKSLSETIDAAATSIASKASRIVLLSGPTASGKTTCSKLITKALADKGRAGIVVSLDDFFFDIKDRKHDGNENLESIEMLDTDFIHYCLKQLLSGEPTHMPTFDFANHKRTFTGKQMLLARKDVVIIEGIHALNPKVVGMFAKNSFHSVFINVEGSCEFEDGKVLTGTDIRLLRRLSRDIAYRGADSDVTLDGWNNVTKSEATDILPYAENADFHINSFLEYEPFVMRKSYVKALSAIDDDGKYPDIKNKYYEIVKKIPPVSASVIPENSILHEFIG